jgi:hypothetical protein
MRTTTVATRSFRFQRFEVTVHVLVQTMLRQTVLLQKLSEHESVLLLNAYATSPGEFNLCPRGGGRPHGGRRHFHKAQGGRGWRELCGVIGRAALFSSPLLTRKRVATRVIGDIAVKAMACSHRYWGMGSARVVRV